MNALVFLVLHLKYNFDIGDFIIHMYFKEKVILRHIRKEKY